MEIAIETWYNTPIIIRKVNHMEHMEIHTNQELAKAVNAAIKESGIKKTVLAEKIGLSRQGLDVLLKKQSFSLDDANRILDIIHLSVSAEIK